MVTKAYNPRWKQGWGSGHKLKDSLGYMKPWKYSTASYASFSWIKGDSLVHCSIVFGWGGLFCCDLTFYLYAREGPSLRNGAAELWAAICLLGVKPGSSVGAASVLNDCAISPAPITGLLICFLWSKTCYVRVDEIVSIYQCKYLLFYCILFYWVEVNRKRFCYW